MAQTAQNIGDFATQRAVNEENLRAQSFADQSAHNAASFALGGLGQAFQQRQQAGEQAWRQDQQSFQNNLHQQELNQQGDYQQQQLAAGLERARIGADAGIDRANIAGQYGIDRTAMQQSGAYDRNAEDNAVKQLLAQNNIDWRTANAATVQQAREHIQTMRGQQAQELEGLRFQNRSALQENEIAATANRQQDRINQRPMPWRADPSLAQGREQRITNHQDFQRQLNLLNNTRLEISDIEKKYKDPFGGMIPMPPNVSKRYSDLIQYRQSLADQLRAAGPMPNAQQLYGSAPAEDPNFNPNLPDANTPTVQNPDFQATPAPQDFVPLPDPADPTMIFVPAGYGPDGRMRYVHQKVN